MMHFFPNPYPDEILYSVLARYSIRSGMTSRQAIAESIFGKTSARAVMELPFNLRALGLNLPVGGTLTAESIIRNHTLYPFFTAFLSTERADAVQQMMMEENGASVYMTAGAFGGRVPLNTHMRYCPACWTDDLACYGERYWHRIHQVPLITTCPHHGCFLIDSAVKVREFNPQVYIAADMVDMDGNKIEEEECTSASWQIARDLLMLFDIELPQKSVEWFAAQYREQLKNTGYANLNGRVYWENVISDFVQCYGEPLLDDYRSNVMKQGQGNWIREITHMDGRPAHPIRHVLFSRFLGIPLEELFTKEIQHMPFGPGPWVCLNPAADHYLKPVIGTVSVSYRRRTKNINGSFACSCGHCYIRAIKIQKGGAIEEQFLKTVSYGPVWGLRARELLADGVSVAEIAARLQADPMTVMYYTGLENRKHKPRMKGDTAKTQEKHRTVWLAVVKANPDAGRRELRRLAGYSATWLCKNDREWWEQHAPVGKFVQAVQMADWVARDEDIYIGIMHTVKHILESDEKPQRISIRLLEKQSGIKSLSVHLNRLPKTKAYIESVIESPIDLHRRRIRWAITQLERTVGKITVNEVLKMTGVGNRYRADVRNIVLEQMEQIDRSDE